MRLVVDANILIAEVLRKRGRQLLVSAQLELFGSETSMNETAHELGKRVSTMASYGHLTNEQAVSMLDEVLVVIAACVRTVPADVYESRLDEAYSRIPRDVDDAPTVALALALECGIWTSDRDFFGCGLPVWSTEALQSYLDRGSPL